ncbi:MAG TPA: hypothetical protein VIH85_27325 [Solirubrobacteraceae bacterium]|jgi:hypothetical protein
MTDVAEALAHAPERTQDLLADAGGGAAWRGAFNLSELTPRVVQAIDSIGQALAAATPEDGVPSFDALLAGSQEDRPDELPLDRLARRVLRSALEQLRTRQGAIAPGRN